MRPSVVYLAGPIDFEVGGGKKWREQTSKKLMEAGIASFSPAHAFTAPFTVADGISHKLVDINTAALIRCDVMLTVFPDKLSIGTAREVEIAVQHGVPVIAVLEREPGHYLFDTTVVKTLEEGIAKIINGDVPEKLDRLALRNLAGRA